MKLTGKTSFSTPLIMTALHRPAPDMQKNVLEVTSFKDTYLEGTVNAEKDGSVLFTTIPYENGWTITVNGKKGDS